MLSLQQYQIIEEELSKETAREFIETMLKKYANSVENISELLSYIPKLAEKQLRVRQVEINQYSWATDMLIADRHLHPHKYKKDEKIISFVHYYTLVKHILKVEMQIVEARRVKIFSMNLLKF